MCFSVCATRACDGPSASSRMRSALPKLASASVYWSISMYSAPNRHSTRATSGWASPHLPQAQPRSRRLSLRAKGGPHCGGCAVPRSDTGGALLLCDREGALQELLGRLERVLPVAQHQVHAPQAVQHIAEHGRRRVELAVADRQRELQRLVRLGQLALRDLQKRTARGQLHARVGTARRGS